MARTTNSDRRVPLRTLVAYGLPAVGFASVGIMTSTFLSRFYTDTVGVPLSQISVVAAAVPFFDAITDPMLGILSDRCRSKHGRRKPFFVVGSVLAALSFLALFVPPRPAAASAASAATAYNTSREGNVTTNTTCVVPPTTATDGAVTGATLYAASMLFLVTLFLTVARQPWVAWGVDLTTTRTANADANDNATANRSGADAAAAGGDVSGKAATEAAAESTRVAASRELPFGVGCLLAAVLPLGGEMMFPASPFNKVRRGGRGGRIVCVVYVLVNPLTYLHSSLTVRTTVCGCRRDLDYSDHRIDCADGHVRTRPGPWGAWGACG